MNGQRPGGRWVAVRSKKLLPASRTRVRTAPPTRIEAPVTAYRRRPKHPKDGGLTIGEE